jgi:multidrug resistance efflux pump
LLATAADLYGLMRPAVPGRTAARRWLRRGVGLAVVAGLAVWLALPAPLSITATGEALAADVTVIALPTDGYLSQVQVRNGDPVAVGAPIARFTSPQLEDALAEARLQASIEQLNAQVALADNKYAEYQISEQRLEVASTRITQLTDKIASLSIVSPVGGRVLNAMPATVTGAFSQTGQEVATVQTSDRMFVKMALERLDARLVRQGMEGTVFFRGLANRAFALKVLNPATVVVDSRTGAERVEALAELTAPDGVIAGMSGIISLEGEPAPRIVSYGRYAYEFLRAKSWTYLGLKF